MASLSSRLAADESLRASFERAYRRAADAWPGVEVGRDELLRYLDERLGQDEVAPDFERLRVEDLYLACGCLAKQRAALDAFGASFAGEIEAAGAGLPEGPAELRQAVQTKLFTAEPGGRPKIADYAGRGSLRSWVRVTALRMRIDAERSRKSKRELHDGDKNVLAQLPDARENPELSHMRLHYRDAFERALAEAFATLSPKQRNMLRHKLVDRLRHDQLAALHGVNERTIKRWLADARQRVLEETRAALGRMLGIASAEVDSVMRLLQSDLDVSVQRYLETADD